MPISQKTKPRFRKGKQLSKVYKEGVRGSVTPKLMTPRLLSSEPLQFPLSFQASFCCDPAGQRKELQG